MAAHAGANDQSDWLGGYVERVRDLLAETARANAELAELWGERSLGDEEWTAVTMTADAIETWEQITPLAGQGIDLWLELVQRTMPPVAPPTAASTRRRADAGGGEPADRLARYADLWESASTKLSAGEYRSEDLVDDWFNWLGMAARDATAALTLLARAAQADEPPENDGAAG